MQVTRRLERTRTRKRSGRVRRQKDGEEELGAGSPLWPQEVFLQPKEGNLDIQRAIPAARPDRAHARSCSCPGRMFRAGRRDADPATEEALTAGAEQTGGRTWSAFPSCTAAASFFRHDAPYQDRAKRKLCDVRERRRFRGRQSSRSTENSA